MLIVMRNPSVSWCSCADLTCTHQLSPADFKVNTRHSPVCETCPPAPRSALTEISQPTAGGGETSILSVDSWNKRKCSFSCSQPCQMHFGFKRMSKPFTEILRCKQKSPNRERLCASIPFPLPEEQFEAGNGQRGKWYPCRHLLVVELCSSSSFEAVSTTDTSSSITDCYPYFCNILLRQRNALQPKPALKEDPAAL